MRVSTLRRSQPPVAGKRRRTWGKLDAPAHRRTPHGPSPMILLHVAAAALYALTAGRALAVARAGRRRTFAAIARGAWGFWLLPAALVLHAWAVVQDTATAQGLDFSLLNAISVVGALLAAVAWASGLLRTVARDRQRSSCRWPRRPCCCRRCCRALSAGLRESPPFRLRRRVARRAARRASRSSPTRCSSSPRCLRSW